MENNRPRGREKHVTGPGKTVQKRGDGLGTGPVGDAGGYEGRKQGASSGTRSTGARGGGGIKLIGLLLLLLLGGGGGLTALLGGLGGSSGGGDMVSALLEEFLSGGFGRVSGLTADNTGFLSDRAMSEEETVQYLAENRFPDEALVWQSGEDGAPVLRLSEQQWGLVQELELNMFYDDGEGYIDLGLDNTFTFDDAGGLLGTNSGTWLAINGQPVAYYHIATVDDGTFYTITGRVPVLYNGSRAELILVFDSDQPYGFVAGVQPVYHDGETDTVAKSQAGLQPGDTLEFLCDYYSYGGDYQDSYLLGEPLVVTEAELAISDVTLDGVTQAAYRFTDLYGQHHWTPALPAE